jgi:hypothetical protein
MTFSAGFIEMLLYGALGAIVIGLATLGWVFVIDLRRKTLW